MADSVSTIVQVEDERCDWLCKQFDIKAKHLPFITFVDTPALVGRSFYGEGLGVEFLDDIRDVDVLVHVLRGFEDDELTHYDEVIDPVRDMQVVNQELMLKDLSQIERAIQNIELLIRDQQGGVELKLERETLIEAWDFLAGEPRPFTLYPPEDPVQKKAYSPKKAKAPPPVAKFPEECVGFPIRLKKWTARQIDLIERYKFLTAKPVVFLVNVTERDYLRSIPRSGSLVGRENHRVREVLDAVFAYESAAYRAGEEATRRAMGGGSMASSASVGSTAVEESGDLSPLGSPTGRFPSASIPTGSKAVALETPSASLFLPSIEITASVEPDDDSVGLQSLSMDELPVTSVAQKFRGGRIDLGEPPDENESTGSTTKLLDIRYSSVMCCSLLFETRLAFVRQTGAEAEAEHYSANPNHKSMIPRLMDELYKTMGLIRFYTLDVLKSQTHVWLVRRGATTTVAAAVIHTNISRGFIRGDIVNYDDLWSHYTTAAERGQALEAGQPGLAFALENLRLEGLYRSQGVKYVVNDGDVIDFHAHPHATAVVPS